MKIQTKLLLAAASMLVLALGGSGGYYFAMRQMRASDIAAFRSELTRQAAVLV